MVLTLQKHTYFEYIENFTTKKWKRGSFHISAQYIDCGNLLELPRRGCLFVLRFYGPVNPLGHVEHGQFT